MGVGPKDCSPSGEPNLCSNVSLISVGVFNCMLLLYYLFGVLGSFGAMGGFDRIRGAACNSPLADAVLSKLADVVLTESAVSGTALLAAVLGHFGQPVDSKF